MLKFDFTKEEYDKFIKDIMFSPLQERIINYRARKYSIVQMAEEENVSTSTISREIKDIEKKIIKSIKSK